MRRKALLLVSVLTLMSLTACGKAKTSEEAQAVIDKINTIGEVDYDDEILIGECEEAYIALTSEQQEEVTNFDTLSEARKKMDELIAKRPIPFSSADWETSEEQLKELHGKPDEEYDNDIYGHILSYNNMENDGYKGTAKFCFEKGKLTGAMFFIEGYDESIVKHFRDIYQTKYGDPDYNENGLVRWDTENASYGANGGGLLGDMIRIDYMSPVSE